MKVFRKCVLLSAATLLALAVGTPAHASPINANEYLSNPSFETGGALAAWHVTPNNGGAFVKTDGPATAPDGSNYLEFYKDAGSPGASVFSFWQQLALPTDLLLGNGYTYDLTFWVRAPQGIGGLSTTDLSVLWTRDPFNGNGGVTGNMCDGFGTAKLTGQSNDTDGACRFDLDTSAELPGGWTQYTLSYVSGGSFAGQHLGIAFNLTGLDNGTDRIDIDFKSPTSTTPADIAAVPEPASLTLLASGLIGGVGKIIRRRRRSH